MTKVNAQTFARGYKKRIQLGKTLYRFPDFINRKYFTLILKTMILTALVNSVTCMEMFTIQKPPKKAARKIQIKVSQSSRENTSASVSFFSKVAGLRPATLLKNRLRHRCFPVDFVKFLRNFFWKATVSQNMKAFKVQVISSVKLKIGWIYITIKIRHRKTSKISSPAYIFQRLFLSGLTWANMQVRWLSGLICLGGKLIPWG